MIVFRTIFFILYKTNNIFRAFRMPPTYTIFANPITIALRAVKTSEILFNIAFEMRITRRVMSFRSSNLFIGSCVFFIALFIENRSYLRTG